jgi:hypothetical protein
VPRSFSLGTRTDPSLLTRLLPELPQRSPGVLLDGHRSSRHGLDSHRYLLVRLCRCFECGELTDFTWSSYTIYLWQVTNYGNIAFLANSPWSFAVDPAMTGERSRGTFFLSLVLTHLFPGIVAFVCQTFYAYRAYIVGKRSAILPIIIVFFSLVQLGPSFVVSIILLSTDHLHQQDSHAEPRA